MGIKQAVTTIYKSRDESVSKIFNRMGKSADKFGEKGSRAFRKVNKSATSAGSVMKGVLGAGLVQKGLGLVSRGLTSVTTDFLNFDHAITAASAKFKGLDITTKEGIKTLESLKMTARGVGATTEFNAAQAAGGLDFLALAGFNADQAMALLPGVANLATVANVDLATATDIASDSLGAFGLMTKKTEQLTINFNRVQDVMAKTTATSNTNLTDLFEAVKKGAPDFTAAGQSIETFSALIGTMANAGIKGSEAGTKLRNIAVRLTGGSDEAADAMEALGIRVADSEGNYRDMLDIIDDVIKGTSRLGEVQKAAALKTIFGARQTGGLNVILKEGTKRLRSYRQMLIDSKSAAEKMATVMRSSLMNRLKSLGSAATEVGFQLFSAFDEQGADAIERLTSFIRTIDMTPLINGIKEVTKITAPLWGTVKDNFKTLKTFMQDTGVFETMLKTLKTSVDTIQTLSKLIGPTLTKLKPVVNFLLDGLNETLNVINRANAFFGKEEELEKKKQAQIIQLISGGEAGMAPKGLQKDTGIGGIIDNINRFAYALTGLDKTEQEIQDQNLIRKAFRAISPTEEAKKNISEAFTFERLFSSSKNQPPEKNQNRQAPARQQPPQQQQSTFSGTLDINGAPEGSDFKQNSTGPGQIDVKMKNKGKQVFQEAG